MQQQHIRFPDGSLARGPARYLDDLQAFVTAGVASTTGGPGRWRHQTGIWGARNGQLLSAGPEDNAPLLTFTPELRGRFAVLAGIYTRRLPELDNDWLNWTARRRYGIYLRASGDPHFRLVLASRNEPAFEEVWCATLDLDGRSLEVAALDLNVWLDYLKLVPVESPAVAGAKRPLVGIVDFADDAEFSEPAGFEAGSSVLRHAELGFDCLMWKAYAVRCEYNTQVGEQRRYSYLDAPADLIPASQPPEPGRRTFGVGGLLLQYDTLAQAVQTAKEAGVEIFGWVRVANESPSLGWEQFGGTPFHLANPHAVQRDKAGTANPRLSFCYPEVVEHKLAIIREIAGYGVDGIMIDVLRHPPMVAYDAPAVAAYRAQTGVDPAQADGDGGESWLRFRAAYFTRFLAAVRQALAQARPDGCKLYVRTVDQVWRNLQVGCDVESWLDADLVDGLILGPHCALHDNYPESLDLTWYTQRTAVPVFGQVWRYSSAVLAGTLARQCYQQGAHGVALYESNLAVANPALRNWAWRLARPEEL